MGLVYFDLARAGEVVPFEVGTGAVLETTDFEAAVRVDRGVVAEPGHLVRFEIPERRLVGPGLDPGRTLDSPKRFPESVVSGDVDPCLNVRPFPARFATPLDCLSPGTSVEIIDQESDWSRIRLPDGTVGWVADSFLRSARTTIGPRRTEPAAPRPSEVESMKRRLDAAEAALEASEAARSDLERRLEEAATAAEARSAALPDLTALEAQLQESAQSLERLRSYRLKLHNALAQVEGAREDVVEQIVEDVMLDLEGELRETAAALESTARERDDLTLRFEAAQAEIAFLRRRLEGSDESRPAAVEEAAAARAEADARATAAEVRATELEVHLRRAEDQIAELERRLQEQESMSPERVPSVPGPLTTTEIPPAADARSGAESAEPAVDEVATETDGTSAARSPGEPGRSASHIENVTWKMENGALLVILTLDGKVSKDDCQVLRVRAGNPRDVLKIRGLGKALSPPVIEIGAGNVSRLRSGLHWEDGTSEVHLVADLERPEVGIRKVTIRGNVLVIKIS